MIGMVETGMFGTGTGTETATENVNEIEREIVTLSKMIDIKAMATVGIEAEVESVVETGIEKETGIVMEGTSTEITIARKTGR